MLTHQQDLTEGAQPALVLLYGTTGTDHRRRLLDKDALVVGKTRGCDLVLEAPDVSSPHCVISRVGGGYVVRDCHSRAGTLVNGAAVREATLHDGDLLKVGPFTFQLAVPTPRHPAAASPAEERLRRAEAKRANLARLALGQRRRLREAQGGGNGHATSHAAEAEAAAGAAALQEHVRQCEQKAAKLAEDERDLSRDRDALTREQEAFAREYAEFKQRVRALEEGCGRKDQELEHAFARKVQELEESFVSRQKELTQSLARTERELAESYALRERELAARAPTPPPAVELTAPAAEEALRVEIRGRELESFACHLQRDRALLDAERVQFRAELDHLVSERQRREGEREQLPAARQQVQEERERLQADRDRLQAERQQLDQARGQLMRDARQTQAEPREALPSRAGWRREQAETAAELERQREAIAQADKHLKQQRADLVRMIGELKEMQDALRGGQSTDEEALREENAQLRASIAHLEEECRAARKGKQPGDAGGDDPEVAKARQENELLRQLLNEKNALLEELRQNPPPGKAETIDDPESYEAELNQFRLQLEADRRKMSEEIQALRVRNEELNDATRELEMEMSRERAELARERTRLDRMRDEVRAELERFQRDAGMRDRLAPVNRLREEILERREGA